MKKIFIILAVVVFSLSSSFSGHAYSQVEVFVNNQPFYYETNPHIINGKLIIPLEETLKAMEIPYKIDDSTVYIEKGDLSITIPLNSYYAYVNEEAISLKRPVRGSNVLLIDVDDLRAILNCMVEWDYDNKILNIFNNNELSVHYIDVGNGDAIFIDYGNYDILIDAGPSDKGEVLVNYLNNLEIDDIDILVLTHLDDNHLGGLTEVLKNFKVENVIHSGVENILDLNKDFYDSVRPGTTLRIMDDQNLLYDLKNGVDFTIIETGDGYDKENDNSVVAMLRHNHMKYLFTGDIEKELEIANLGKFPKIDILKLSNHGSNMSTSEEFLNKTQPKLAINSGQDLVDDEVKKLLDERNIETLETNTEGSIIVTTNGYHYTIDHVKVNGIQVKGIDFSNKKILLHNLHDKDIDISDFVVTDKKGNRQMYLPKDSIIEKGKTALFTLVEEKGTIPEENNTTNPSSEIEGGNLYDTEMHLIAKYK